ncbi:MAG: DsbE family thiol:disulfide interchange protein [Caulobacteraceae bacterium]
MKRLLFFAPLLVLAALAVLFAVYGLNHDPQVKPDAMVGKPAPATVLAGLNGEAPQPLAKAASGVVMVNVFASWCGPCIIEHPLLVRLQARGVRIVGVAYKDKPENIRKFLQQRENPYTTILMDPDGRAGVDLGISGVPETFAIRNGVIVAKFAGPLTPEIAEDLRKSLGAR